jgi:hypothetical protein
MTAVGCVKQRQCEIESRISIRAHLRIEVNRKVDEVKCG